MQAFTVMMVLLYVVPSWIGTHLQPMDVVVRCAENLSYPQMAVRAFGDRKRATPIALTVTCVLVVLWRTITTLRQRMEPQPDGRACNGCQLGFSADGTPCQYCPSGFEANVDRTQCVPCVNQVSGPTTAHLCQSCPAGKQMVERTRCEECQAGSASIDGFGCERCDPGTSPDAGRTQCVPCVSGTFSIDGVDCQT